MRRLLIPAAFLAVLAGTACSPRSASTPTPAPPPSASSSAATSNPTSNSSSNPTSNPSSNPTSSSGPASPSAAASLDPNTAEICEKSRETATQGIEAFTQEINNAGTLAGNGDVRGADKSVKQAGAILVDLSNKVRQDASGAQKPQLKQALEDVAAELNSLGTGLTSIASLQNFDTGRLQLLGQRVSEICGG